MPALFRFMDWPLRAKMATLLLVVSLVPLAIAFWISLGNARLEQLRSTEAVLAAHSGTLAARIDTLNSGYLNSVSRMALIPSAVTLLQSSGTEAQNIQRTLNDQLWVWPQTDQSIRGVAVLDARGTVVVGTEAALRGVNLGYRSFVKQALQGKTVVSDVYLAEPEVNEVPTIAYLAPMVDADGRVIGAAAFWVNASVLTRLLRGSDHEAGEGSFGVLFDSHLIRIAHSFDDEMVFRPGVKLAPEVIDELVAERRFGERTRELLEPVPGKNYQDSIAARNSPGTGMFRGYAQANEQWNYAVGTRCATAPWTVYYLFPELLLQTDMNRIFRQKIQFAAAIMLLALIVGLLFAAIILRPVRQLSAGARAIGAGNLDTRVSIRRKDELGELGAAFNAMAGRIQQQAEALRRESEDQYRKLFQTMNEAFCTTEVIFDKGGRAIDCVFLEANDVFVQLSGLGDVRGKLRSVLLPDSDDFWLHIVGHVASTGEPIDVERESERRGRHYHVRAYRVGPPEGRRVAMLFSDVTERILAKQRQQAQLESLHLLHQITHAIGERQDLQDIFQVVLHSLEQRLPVDLSCILLRTDDDARLRVVRLGEGSHDRAQWLHLAEGDLVAIEENGLSACMLGKLLYQPDVGEVQVPLMQRLAGSGLASMVAAPLLVESKVFGILMAGRRSGGFSSAECEFLVQLSEHVALAAHQAQLYADLQAAYENLRKTQHVVLQQEQLRALGQMASGIAHDINNAISPIALYSESLMEREAGLSKQGLVQLETIQRAIADVAATVARMREFYRAREPQLSLSPVQLNELVPQVVELTKARWSTQPQEHGITIELRTQLQPGLPVISGAANEIREALTNLVFNAVDAMPTGGTLTLRTSLAEDGRVQLEVRDTGIGMDEDSRRRCLEPFFTTKGERGTGLGLAMVYGMAQRHSAELGIDSAPGEGTCVQLVFRAADAARPVVDVPPVIAPHRQHILVVDDDPVLLRALSEILREEGHTVVTANGGRQGIDLARAALADRQPFTVVITDLGMPHVDGRQVARELKALAPDLPVILLTGWGQRLAVEGDVPPDVAMVLSKPPKLRDIREALARCCGEKSSVTA